MAKMAFFGAFILLCASLSSLAWAQSVDGIPHELQLRGISPEAYRQIPVGPEDGRGHLISLHSSSVLEWLCRDQKTLSEVKTDRAGCYRAMWSGIQACEAQLQLALPRGRMAAAQSGKPDILGFRSQLRQCLESKYAEAQMTKGVSPIGDSTQAVLAAPDPLAEAVLAPAAAP